MSITDTQQGKDQVRAFIEPNENDELQVYLDSADIPTVGIGYALVIEQNGTWVVRPDLVSDLRDAGILPANERMSPGDLQRL